MAVKAYTIVPKDGGGFTLTIPGSFEGYGFPTKEAALAKVHELIGDDYSKATMTNRNDGGINVYVPQG